MVFHILFGLSVLAAGIALYRLRPASLIIAVNNAILLRSLANISDFGKPASQRPVPAWVFGRHQLDVAENIFLIVTPLLLASVLMPAPSGPSKPAKPLP